METLRLLPLARAEIEGNEPSFLERLFEGGLRSAGQNIVGDKLV